MLQSCGRLTKLFLFVLLVFFVVVVIFVVCSF